MRNTLVFVSVLFVILSCSKVKENAKFNNFIGQWKIDHLDSICYSSEAIVENTYELPVNGKLILESNRTYSSNGFIELEASGDWNLFFHGKKDVIVFKEVRSTVFKKKKNILQLDFTGGENGSLLYVKRYFLVKQ